MSEMVERVALAIGCAAGEPLMWPFGEVPSDEVKDKLRNMARAAIEAMWEPTEEMLHAGKIQIGAENGIKEIWQAMIDEARK